MAPPPVDLLAHLYRSWRRATPGAQALEEIRLEPVAHVVKSGGTTGNGDGHNPEGSRGSLSVMVPALLTVLPQKQVVARQAPLLLAPG